MRKPKSSNWEMSLLNLLSLTWWNQDTKYSAPKPVLVVKPGKMVGNIRGVVSDDSGPLHKQTLLLKELQEELLQILMENLHLMQKKVMFGDRFYRAIERKITCWSANKIIHSIEKILMLFG
jgi:hypothetical protein